MKNSRFLTEWFGFGSVLLLWVLFVLAGLSDGSYSAWFMSGGLGIILLNGIAMKALALRKVEVERSLAPDRWFAGGQSEVMLTVRHRSHVPIPWLVVSESWTNCANRQVVIVRKIAFPWLRRTCRLSYRLSGLPRGKYTLTRLTVTAGEWFGFTGKVCSVPGNAVFFVYPERRSIAGFLPVRPSSEGEKPLLLPWAEGREPAGYVRNYASGDPLNRIHWKASAKTDELKSAVTTPAEQNRYMIALECSVTAYGGKNVPPLSKSPTAASSSDRFEKAVQLASSFYRYFQAKGEKVVFVHNSMEKGGDVPEKESAVSPSRRLTVTEKKPISESAAKMARNRKNEAAAEMFAAIRADGGTSLYERIRHRALRSPEAVHLLWVTPCIDERLAAAAIELARRKWRVHVLHILNETSPSYEQRAWYRRLAAFGCGIEAVCGRDKAQKKDAVREEHAYEYAGI